MTVARCEHERDRCTCIAIGHDHEPRECKRAGKIRGGSCTDCHYWTRNDLYNASRDDVQSVHSPSTVVGDNSE